MENNCCNLCEGCVHQAVCSEACGVADEGEPTGVVRETKNAVIMTECPNFLEATGLSPEHELKIAQNVYRKYTDDINMERIVIDFKGWLDLRVASLDSAIKEVQGGGKHDD